MLRSMPLALLAFPLLAGPASAQRPLVTAMPPGEEACYGRIYDGAHLSANPQQTIVEFFLARLHTSDPQREDEPLTRERSIEETVSSETDEQPVARRTPLEIMALTREPRGRYGASVSCTSADGVTLQCGVDCDGGGFSAQVNARDATIRFRQHGARVGPGCGEGGNIMLGGRQADRNVRLSRLPVSACLAARDAGRPDWVRHGPSLRETLPGRGTACFARSYDAAHLARTPGQQVASMALSATWRAAGSDGLQGIDISLRARLRDGSGNVATARCYAQEYAFHCEVAGIDGALVLTRGPNGGVIIRGQQGADPEEAPSSYFARLLDLPLGRADDGFRLDAADAQACTP